MKKILITISLSILTILLIIYMVPSGEPNEKYVKSDFKRLNPNCNLIQIIEKDVSPPCSDWELKYKCSNQDSMKIEIWQYCKNDKKGKWKLNISEIKMLPIKSLQIYKPERLNKNQVSNDCITLTSNENKYYLKQIKDDISYFKNSYKRADLTIDIDGLNIEQSAKK